LVGFCKNTRCHRSKAMEKIVPKRQGF
jgi:hypothetical protein